MLIAYQVTGMILPEDIASGSSRDLVMTDVRRIAEGMDSFAASGMAEAEIVTLSEDPAALKTALEGAGVALGADINPHVAAAAVTYRQDVALGRLWMSVFVLAFAIAGLFLSARRVGPELRSRNVVERYVQVLLVSASMIAILTTAGIVFSLVFESVHFFQLYPAKDFFLSLTWTPKFGGGSDLGIWPLLWGTLYVSFIALLVAVPIGLMSAIYLSEYAGPKLRGMAKPALEVLAGIPSIVYGLFALLTVGPFLRDYFAQPLGLGDSSSSVMTAGIVMGVMLIPYVSSLSDDIINAVPQALRDGSYALGATQSETVRQVVLPAALPGIVGAVLMAASRAIGETMIVVLGAGAAAKLDLNPFEAMTTVTVKIVSQLTGDTEFASPETLVAFALGLTLFVFTLCLNIIALFIVRKYREQYE
jgi:phosphate transport system permease protein